MSLTVTQYTVIEPHPTQPPVIDPTNTNLDGVRLRPGYALTLDLDSVWSLKHGGSSLSLLVLRPDSDDYQANRFLGISFTSELLPEHVPADCAIPLRFFTEDKGEDYCDLLVTQAVTFALARHTVVCVRHNPDEHVLQFSVHLKDLHFTQSVPFGDAALAHDYFEIA